MFNSVHIKICKHLKRDLKEIFNCACLEELADANKYILFENIYSFKKNI